MRFSSVKLSKDKIMAVLEDFEKFCLGQKHLSPEEFMEMNEELSLSAVLNIGRNRLERHEDGSHLIWAAPDNSEHDLGPIERLDIMRECPGFHRTRSLCVGQEYVAYNELVHVPQGDRHISKVQMKDGSVGYGPNYKIALRNAALKMHLKGAFEKANPPGLWRMFYGNA